MNSEELLFVKRIQDLSDTAQRRGCVTFTDFLNLNEQNILHQTLQKFSWIKGETFGGYEGAERQIAAFIPDALYITEDQEEPACPVSYPISCIRIAPRNAKFADRLTHRDILGALMNLGIERSKTGDIAVCENEAYLFCAPRLAELICRELTRIRHTSVDCTLCDLAEFSYRPKTEAVRGSVASIRLDAVMAIAFQSSRSSLLSLISGGCVFINGKVITTNAYALKERDVVSVRGHGRFRYIGEAGATKKGRHMIELEKYI